MAIGRTIMKSLHYLVAEWKIPNRYLYAIGAAILWSLFLRMINPQLDRTDNMICFVLSMLAIWCWSRVGVELYVKGLSKSESGDKADS
jgi:hypothetical protein